MAMIQVTKDFNPDEEIEIKRNRKKCAECGNLYGEPKIMEPRHWLNDHARRYKRDGIKTEIRSNPKSGKIALYADVDIDPEEAEENLKRTRYQRKYYQEKKEKKKKYSKERYWRTKNESNI